MARGRPSQSSKLRRNRTSFVGARYLITFKTLRRTLFVDSQLAETAFSAISEYHNHGRIYNFAAVVMPDHVHWVFALLRGDLVALVTAYKTWTARQIGLGPIWMAGYHDRRINSDRMLHNAVRYVELNPVKACLVECAADYPWMRVWSR